MAIGKTTILRASNKASKESEKPYRDRKKMKNYEIKRELILF